MKIGLLPLYIKLYDDGGGTLRLRLEPFYNKIAEEFEKRGIEVITSPFCRLESEFAEEVKKYEEQKADCIVTLHMAYSPSLESSEVLTKTELPIVVLDTTETFDFSPSQNPAEINYCHGIHGVMDMCNLLKRGGKEYAICAGHYEESDVMDRCIGFIKASVAANSLKGSKVGSVGGSFDGMGDFLVSDEEMKEIFGVEVVYADKDELASLIASVTDEETEREIEADKKAFKGEVSEEIHKVTARNCLGLRKWIEKKGLSAFTVNFRKIGPESGITVMPFMEAGKEMAKGTGYAGEGDALTAAFTGALLKGFKNTSFVEIFCPDWKNDTLFISHMGEMNNAVMSVSEIKETPFSYGQPSSNPAVSYGRFMKGKAVFANVYRDTDGFKLLVAPVEMLEPYGDDNFFGKVRGWMKPEMPIAQFLEKISKAGVTHHSVLIYDATPEQIDFFGRISGLKVVTV